MNASPKPVSYLRAWLTSQTTALQRLWTLMHVAVMAWGLAMVVQARQPHPP